jgi:hypothetical protein
VRRSFPTRCVPLRRFARGARCTWSVTGPGLPLVEFHVPSEFLPVSTSARIGQALPSCPFPRQGGLQGFRRHRLLAMPLSVASESSHGLVRSFRVLRAPSRRAVRWPSRAPADRAAPSMRFAPLQRLPARRSTLWTGLPHPAGCALRFSRPLGALIHREPTGLVSCRIRSWGCTLQSFPPTPWPYAVSGADPLLTLDPPDTISPIAFRLSGYRSTLAAVRVPKHPRSCSGAEAPSQPDEPSFPPGTEAPFG